MAVICPQCGREFLGSRSKCPVCGCNMSNSRNISAISDNQEIQYSDSQTSQQAFHQKKKTGMITSTQRNKASSVYKKMRNYLKPKDGKTHIVMINSFSKWLNQNFECENKYTTQINEILSCMQDEGYEIIDIKFNSLMNQGLFGQMEGFHTLITYR